MMSENPTKEVARPHDKGETLRPADATLNWVDKFAPERVQPYLRLARLDRPVGAWLLLWPCWWSLAMAAPNSGNPWPDFKLLVLFGIGAVVMRGAGCTLNDLMDRDIDAQVERTRGRPLPSGAVSVPAAIVFMLGLGMVGLAVLSQLNQFAIWVGMASVPLIVIYPLMKRVTYWPQLFLGLTFNWGALLGWAAATGELTLAPICLYVAGIFWTLGYDTIYAHQDKEDDALVGVRSSALRLGDDTRPWLWGFYGAAIIMLGISGVLAGMAWPFYLALAATAAQLAWQASEVDISDSGDCLKKFKSNIGLGWVVFAGCVLGAIM